MLRREPSDHYPSCKTAKEAKALRVGGKDKAEARLETRLTQPGASDACQMNACIPTHIWKTIGKPKKRTVRCLKIRNPYVSLSLPPALSSCMNQKGSYFDSLEVGITPSIGLVFSGFRRKTHSCNRCGRREVKSCFYKRSW